MTVLALSPQPPRRRLPRRSTAPRRDVLNAGMLLAPLRYGTLRLDPLQLHLDVVRRLPAIGRRFREASLDDVVKRGRSSRTSYSVSRSRAMSYCPQICGWASAARALPHE